MFATTTQFEIRFRIFSGRRVEIFSPLSQTCTRHSLIAFHCVLKFWCSGKLLSAELCWLLAIAVYHTIGTNIMRGLVFLTTALAVKAAFAFNGYNNKQRWLTSGKQRTYNVAIWSDPSRKQSSLFSTPICPEVSLIPRRGMDIAIVACGWFWGPQPEYQAMYGVTKCVVGYSGGKELNPSYSEMKDHTESVLVEFDTNLISYQLIVEKWKSLSSPYADEDRQYRSAIFFRNANQEAIAREACAGMEDLVDVEPATKFYLAESRHQNFLARL